MKKEPNMNELLKLDFIDKNVTKNKSYGRYIKFSVSKEQENFY